MLITHKTYNRLVEAFERAVLKEYKPFKEEERMKDLVVVNWVFGGVCHEVLETAKMTMYNRAYHKCPRSDFYELLFLYTPNGSTPGWYVMTDNLRAWVKQRFDAIDLSHIPEGKVVYLKEVA